MVFKRKNKAGLTPMALSAWILRAVFLLTMSGVWGIAYGGETGSYEIQALVGVKIPPKKPGISSGDIRGLVGVGNGVLFSESVGNSMSLGYEIGSLKNTPLFVIDRVYKDRTREILGVQTLPSDLVDWTIRDGKTVFLKGRYRLSTHCETTRKVSGNQNIVLGLVRPERGKANCAHESTHVKRAWQIDKTSGKIKEIPTTGLKCYFETMSEC